MQRSFVASGQHFDPFQALSPRGSIDSQYTMPYFTSSDGGHSQADDAPDIDQLISSDAEPTYAQPFLHPELQPVNRPYIPEQFLQQTQPEAFTQYGRPSIEFPQLQQPVLPEAPREHPGEQSANAAIQQEPALGLRPLTRGDVGKYVASDGGQLKGEFPLCL